MSEKFKQQDISVGKSIEYFAHLRQECNNSKSVIFQEKILEVLKCYNFLWVQRRHNCSPAASFANCAMTLYLLEVHLQTFLSIPITQKFQVLSCDTLVANGRYIKLHILTQLFIKILQLKDNQIIFNFNMFRFLL